MKPIPATLQTAYANLLQAHLNSPPFEFEGAPYTTVRRGKTYWYVNQRGLGSDAPRQRYLGPDTEEMRARIETMRVSVSDQADFRENCSRMIAQLRAGGIPAMDRRTGPLLRALAKSGVFRLGGTLVGTHAFRHYDLELGVVLTGDDAEDMRLRETDDLDIASFERLSAVIDDEAEPDLARALTGLGFSPANTLRKKQPTTWRHARSTYAVDFLTPSFEEDEAPRYLEALNIWAQGLHYLDFLIKNPMPAVSIYMEGILVQVPRPERYAVHKLIIAQDRPAGSRAKARKDVQQARAIIGAMSEDEPYVIKQTIAEADGRGPTWRTALDRALEVKFTDHPPFRANGDSIHLEATALGAKPTFRISGSALAMLAKGSGQDDEVIAKEHRDLIENMFRRKFRTQPSADTLLRADDLAELAKAAR
ncbi:MAG TPA: GSU2403 family nucleotidyltransferase fold protein [Hyphomonadaceae bacterium]|nr:GSU2403 family nucleotidyltransferase fold protein [Hyphomonadaceae bacterium]